FKDLLTIYSRPTDIVKGAIALYHQKHGGFELEGPYPDKVVQDLEDYFQAAEALTKTADKAITAGNPSSFEQLATQAGQGQSLDRIQEILGVKGTTLLLTARAAQRGVDLASLVHDVQTQAYLNTAAALNKELIDIETEDTQWLGELARNGNQRDKLLNQLGVPKLDPTQFENLINATIADVRTNVATSKKGRYATINVEQYL
ncbi:hypothetical protein, partial [Cylindrospermopsis raciborskii]|uniref:hypothetical protein n=1 Tax=Cylindrospermopsis raciborskii TaxID=77022 RepID=UPI0022BC1919